MSVTMSAAKVVGHQELSHNFWKLSLHVPEIASSIQAGQFVHVRCANGEDPLLRRPFSVMAIRADQGELDIVYEVVGRGTALLARAAEGAEVDLLGPLGHGYTINGDARVAVLVGGGVGITPLPALAERLRGHGIGTLWAFLGARTREAMVCQAELEALCDHVHLATDDGTLGRAGLVTGELEERLVAGELHDSAWYACGPWKMMQRVSALAEQFQMPCQCSLEARMGCAMGVCLGCVVPTTQGYQRTCRTGPVFDSRQVCWDQGHGGYAGTQTS